MRPIFFCSILAVLSGGLSIGAARADDEPTKAAESSTEDLIRDLGHLDYATRESATKALIARGEKARAALQKALESEDVEVRMRAGRALRGVDAKKNAQGKITRKPQSTRTPEAVGSGAGTRRQTILRYAQTTVSIKKDGDRIVVTVSARDKDGKSTTKVYSGSSLEEIKKNDPEARKALGELNLTFAPGSGGSPFSEFDKLFAQGWGRPRDADFWKNADADLNREIERLSVWVRRLAEQQRRDVRGRGQGNRARSKEIVGRKWGIRAHRPEAVLDAQLQLRGRGLVIEEVAPKSPAAQLGLVRYDILLELNGAPIRGHEDVGPAVRGHDKNAPLRAKVLRRAKIVDLELKSAR